MRIGLGILAFGLFWLGDWNDWKWGRRALRLCFPAGLVLLAASTVLLCGRVPPARAAVRALLGAAGAALLALLVYTLFFALPAGEAYVTQNGRRPACTTGVYALCRHPGVLWFFLLYLCLWGALGVPLLAGLLFSLLNVLLVMFEDRFVFPDRLEGYEAYRASTPFLLPTARSLRACAESLRVRRG